MRRDQVTVTMPEPDAGWQFYGVPGLRSFVDVRPRHLYYAGPNGAEPPVP